MKSILFSFITAALFLVTYSCGPTPFPKVGDAYAATSGPKEHFFASYYGVNSWSKDFRYVAVLETDLVDRLPETGETAEICLVDLQDNNKLIPVARTHCWNFQEATMFHWLPWADDTFIYNDMRDGRFVSVILNWKTGEERIIPYPISAVTDDGLKAVSINYARLHHTRPDYGYPGNGQDARTDVSWPEDDGLWLVDLKTGEAKLIVSVASQRDKMTTMKDPKGLAYFCHTVFSKGGSHIFWLARTVENLEEQGSYVGKWKTTSFTCNVDGSDVRRCFPDKWGGSHFNWLDDNTIMVTANMYAGKEVGHVMVTVGDEENRVHVAPGLMDWNSHCLFSPDGKFVSCDGYINKDMYRSWALLRLEDWAVIPIGTFYVPKIYKNIYTRCDLHPRFRPDGKQIGFNSVHEGSRQVYLREIEY